MKKFIITALLATVAGLANAANFVSVDVDSVEDSKTGAKSQAQYFRAGTDLKHGYNLGLQVRTAVFKEGGMLNSVEGTLGKNVGPVNVFGGLGHDNGFNGAKNGSYQYGLVGASVGAPLGPFFGYAGVKTRVNWDDANPAQTVTFAGVSYPLNKKTSLNLGWSKSFRDIKEDAWGLGLRVGF